MYKAARRLSDLSLPRPREPSLLRARRRTGGFSLLEVLAAFVILALVGTALFRLFSGALGNASLAEEYSRATLYAESLLAPQGVEAPLKESAQQGTSADGYYSWSLSIDPYSPPGTTPDMENAVPAMPAKLWRLVLSVRWPGVSGSERSIVLTTLRVAVRELNQ